MRRLLVTGGAGFLGSELVRRAPAAGWEVRATFHNRRPELDAEWVRVDVRDREAVARAVEDVDCVVHTAFVQHGPEAWSTTAEGAGVVARAAVGTRLLQLSSDVVFDGVRGHYREEDEPRPVHDYGRAKVEAERLVAAAHPQALIARTSLLYGGPEPGPQERLAAAGGTFFVDEIRSPVQVGDLADALLELAELETAGILHLGGADDVSRYDFALLLGADPDRIEPGLTTPDRCPNVSLDSSRAAALLRTRLRGVREVLA
ncbi:MAG TPA: sugar nucleotide-binding protein [Gaiellaceae bacterium]|nr:sugar nucleotide-binding protein [Gaiellaceae bacterium]